MCPFNSLVTCCTEIQNLRSLLAISHGSENSNGNHLGLYLALDEFLHIKFWGSAKTKEFQNQCVMCVLHKGYLQQILSVLIINLNVKINLTFGGSSQGALSLLTQYCSSLFLYLHHYDVNCGSS